MVRKFLPHLWAITAVVLLSSCSREVNKPTRLLVSFPKADANIMTSQNVSALSTKWGFSDPSTTSQMNCYAILVEANDMVDGASLCTTLAGTVVAKPKYVHGAFAAGTTQEIDVLSGKNRKISLIGFQADVPSECKLIKSSATGLDASQMSAPFILTSTTVDLEPGTQTLALTVPAAIPADSKFEDCAPLAFSGGAGTPAPAALTVTSITPNLGLSSGGTSVVVQGSGFDGTTTVAIGGVPCTSATILANQISCTSGGNAPATYDVVVTKGVEIATLSSAFSYSAPPAMSIADVSLAEASGGSVTVSLSGPSIGPTTVDYTLSAGTAGLTTDYSALSGSLTIASGATSANITLNNIVSDTLDESDETFTVNLSNVSSNAFISDAVGLITITDDDAPPVLSVANASVNENGGSIDITVTASAASSFTMSFAYATTDGTSVAPADYTATSGPSGMITAGNTSTTITVPISQDAIFEGAETFTFTIAGPSNATLGTAVATITINDDDVAPTISIADVSIAEGGTTALVTITASHASSATLNFNYATSNGTALSGSDYGSTSGGSSIAPLATTTQVGIGITQDILDEDDETFNVTISAPSFGTISDAVGVVTITDDDAAPDVQFSVASGSAGEGSGTGTATVILATASGKTVSVDYQVVGGTATGGGGDFTLANGTLTFAPGDVSEDINITIVNDLTLDPGETILLSLSNPVNSALGAQGTHTFTITDNETPAVLTISEIDPYDFGVIAVGGVGERTFTLTNTGGVAATGIGDGAGLAAPFEFKGGGYPGTGTCGGSLNAGANCTFVIQFSPGSMAPFSDTIVINYNDGAGAQVANRDVDGVGAAPAQLDISGPNPWNFGDVQITESAMQTFTITNTGAVTATGMGGSGISGPYTFPTGYPGGGTCGATLAPAGSCTVIVQFAPGATGTVNATFDINYDNGAAPMTSSHNLTGYGFKVMLYSASLSDDHIEIFEVDSIGNLGSQGIQSIAANPRHLLASPDGKFLYASEQTNSNLYSYTIGPAGDLTSLANNTLAYAPSFLAFDRIGRWLMFGLAGPSANFYVQDYNSATGALADVATGPFALYAGINQPHFHRTADVLFVPISPQHSVRAYTISAGGVPTFDVQSTVNHVSMPYGLTSHPSNGNWIYATSEDGGQVVQFVYTSGTSLATAQVAGVNGGSTSAKDVVIHPTLNKLYVLSESPGIVAFVETYSIDGSGAQTLSASHNLSTTDPGSMVMDKAGRFIFVADCANNMIKILSIDQTTGALTGAGTMSTLGACPDGLAVTEVRP